MGNIAKLNDRNLTDVLRSIIAFYLRPVGNIKETCQCLGLFLASRNHRESSIHGCAVAERLSQSYESLHSWTIAILILQSCRHCRLVDVAKRRHIIVGHPSPQPQLLRKQHRTIIEHRIDILYGDIAYLWLFVGNRYAHGRIGLLRSARNDNTHSCPHLVGKSIRYGIGESTLQWQRQYDLCILHVCKDTKNYELCGKNTLK